MASIGDVLQAFVLAFVGLCTKDPKRYLRLENFLLPFFSV